MPRMFAALLPPPDVAEHLEEFLEPRREPGRRAGLRWSAAEQLHLTLGFYPAVADRAVEDLLEHLAAAARRRTRFEVRVAGGGAFPDAASARVLVAGLEAGDAARTELDRLAVGARHAAGRAGTEVDGGRFRPHVTVARLGRPSEVTRWVRLLDAYAGPVWPVTGVALVASHLGEGPRRRPRYEVVAELPLGARATGTPIGGRRDDG